ncbi:MAG TPA: shikimate kinase [Pseudogracilibacillus sp.]|nr:shikimate kinase [Pseudogracilibacillus sp.]
MKLSQAIQRKPIVFIGFMGVGKTTIAREVAKRLGRGFVDIDHEIEKEYQLDIPSIFKQFGEAQFRETEKTLIEKWCKQSKRVISLGGGAFLNAETKQLCLAETLVINLHMPWDEWKERLPILKKNRPNLQGKSLEEIKELFDSRIPIYEQYHLQVSIYKDSSIQDITEDVMDQLKYL